VIRAIYKIAITRPFFFFNQLVMLLLLLLRRRLSSLDHLKLTGGGDGALDIQKAKRVLVVKV
jgi:hypothetical protein